MEDKHIFKGEYAYSVRIDIPTMNPDNDKLVTDKLQQYFSRGKLARENKKDGTPHFQCIFWRDIRLSKNNPSEIRTYFKQKFNYQYKNAISIVSARKITSLAKYCNDKEHKGTISWGIPPETDLGKWENQEALANRLKEIYIEKLSLENQSEWISIHRLCQLACEVYKEVRPPPFKSLLQFGRSAGYLTEDAFIKEYYPSFQGHNNYIRKPLKDNEYEENTVVNYIIQSSESDTDL